MQYAEAKFLASISLPEDCIEILKHINEKALENLNNNPIQNLDDDIPLGPLEQEERAAMLIFDWNAEINGIIENLNIVIHDLSTLHCQSNEEFISRRSRLYFLIRCYFHEFYRFRENFSRVVHALQLWGVYEKPQRKSIQAKFHAAFEEMINMRDSMVHGQVHWKGEDHYELTLHQAAFDQGYALTEKKTGRQIDPASSIQKVAYGYIDIFHQEGVRMTGALQAATDSFWAMLVPPNPPLNSDPTATVS